MHAAKEEVLSSKSEADFAAIVREHRGFVRGVLRRRGVRGADVDDLTQNTFVIAWERQNELPRKRSKQRKWFAGVAFRMAQNWHRSNWHRVELVDPLKLGKMFAPLIGDIEARAIAAALVERLPRLQRDVACLRLQGFSFSEIASKLEISRSMAFTHWQKAQTALKEIVR